ncbi:hypothetical protein D3C85_1721280 [compost metagenome]
MTDTAVITIISINIRAMTSIPARAVKDEIKKMRKVKTYMGVSRSMELIINWPTPTTMAACIWKRYDIVNKPNSKVIVLPSIFRLIST